LRQHQISGVSKSFEQPLDHIGLELRAAMADLPIREDNSSTQTKHLVFPSLVNSTVIGSGDVPDPSIDRLNGWIQKTIVGMSKCF
jgi:hypothetical protein